MDIVAEVAAAKPGVNILRISGRLDATTCVEAEPLFIETLDKSTAGMIVNMSSLEFISSAGLRIMIMLIKKAVTDGKQVGLAGVQPQIYKIFKIAGLDRTFRFVDDESDALRELWP